MSNWRATTYTEHVGAAGPGKSPTETFEDDHQRCVRLLDVAWDNRQQAIQDFLGFGQRLAGPFLSRTTPMPYNDYGAFYLDTPPAVFGAATPQPFMWATRAQVQGLGVPTDKNLKGKNSLGGFYSGTENARYQTARIQTTFESVPYTILNDQQMSQFAYVDSNGNPDEASLARYVEVLPNPAGQYLSVPKGCMKVAGSGGGGTDVIQLGMAPGKIVPHVDIQFRWARVPSVCVPSFLVNYNLSSGSPGAIHTSIGRVNLNQFPPSGPFKNCFAAGSLLLTSVKMTRIRSPVGGQIWDILYGIQFVSPPSYHNYVPYISSGAFTWVEINVDGGTYGPATSTNGKLIYDAVDYGPLFRSA